VGILKNWQASWRVGSELEGEEGTFRGLDNAWDGWLAGKLDQGKSERAVALQMAPAEHWREYKRDSRRVRGRERLEGVSVGVRKVLKGWIGSAAGQRGKIQHMVYPILQPRYPNPPLVGSCATGGRA
jgi:hypothetical protein